MTQRVMPIEELSGYKYRTVIPYTFNPRLPLAIRGKMKTYVSKYLKYNPDIDMVTIEAGYCYDGPSGPMWDSPDTMLGALKHDALYQLMRIGALLESARKRADEVFYETLLECGVNKIRAWYAYMAVRAFAGFAAKRGTERKRTINIPIGEA